MDERSRLAGKQTLDAVDQMRARQIADLLARACRRLHASQCIVQILSAHSQTEAGRAPGKSTQGVYGVYAASRVACMAILRCSALPQSCTRASLAELAEDSARPSLVSIKEGDQVLLAQFHACSERLHDPCHIDAFVGAGLKRPKPRRRSQNAH